MEHLFKTARQEIAPTKESDYFGVEVGKIGVDTLSFRGLSHDIRNCPVLVF